MTAQENTNQRAFENDPLMKKWSGRISDRSMCTNRSFFHILGKK